MREPIRFRFEVAKHDPTRAYVVIQCALTPAGECRVTCRTKHQQEGLVWLWDGNAEAPSVSPSIACAVVGCDKHFTISKGLVT